MGSETDILTRVHAAAAQKVLFLPRAVHQMLRPDRMIHRAEVRQVIVDGEVIEDYPEDARAHSCLLHGCGDEGRPIHVVCTPREDYLAVITAYIPDKNEWCEDFKTRLKK